ncbi:hypothetical protein [Metabacillus fastidiosus]|uniref:hypothetical protein n=1 Tax=Metabacillus fastidiosus TaxID=1458 RepID=UPI003D2C2240
MAKIEFKGDLPLSKKENRIKQGDYVYCKASTGALHFWGIYNSSLETVIALDGGGCDYIKGAELYLGETYSHWTIIKRIPSRNIKIIIEEAS